jgi:hypothetical protein
MFAAQEAGLWKIDRVHIRRNSFCAFRALKTRPSHRWPGGGAGGNHALGIPGQDILRTLIVKEAVETRELER